MGSPFSEVLPAATGGDGTLSYTAIPLPDGLTFDNVSRTVSGTPTKVEAPTVTYTVRDADGDEAIKTFTFTVVADLTPTFDPIAGYTARVGSPFSDVLPAATGGDGTLSYTATPLPDGLTFDNVSRTVSGTPTKVEAPTVTYTVRDADGDEAIKTFTFTVVADLTPTFDPIAGYTARVGSPFSDVLPAATGGDGTLSYTATPLPDGLTFDNVSRTVSGTPTKVEAPIVTYTVRDADGDEAIKTFTFTVVADLTPTFDPIAGYTARVGSPFSDVLPAATGGDGTLSYTATPLPDGLTFDNVSRTVSGTPTKVEAPIVTYTVRDADGDEAIKTFTFTVVADLTPTFDPIAGYTARVGSPFSDVLPAATGGDGTLSYTATPLPDGLTFDNVSRTVSGTPTKVEAPTVTYTVRDADGDEAIKTFTFTVVADLTPTFDPIAGYTARVGVTSSVMYCRRRRVGTVRCPTPRPPCQMVSPSITCRADGLGHADKSGSADRDLHGARCRRRRGHQDLYVYGRCQSDADSGKDRRHLRQIDKGVYPPAAGREWRRRRPGTRCDRAA